MVKQATGSQPIGVNMLDVLFFAALREQLGCDKLSLPADGITNVQSLLDTLVRLHPSFSGAFHQAILVAVNQEMTTREHRLKPGDEIAFFPPVTGG